MGELSFSDQNYIYSVTEKHAVKLTEALREKSRNVT